MRIKVIYRVLIIVLLLSLMGCSKKEDNQKENSQNQNIQNNDEKDKDIIDDIKDNDNRQDDDKNNDDTELIDVDDGNYDSNFELVLYAKDADITGNLKIEDSKEGYDGQGYLVGLIDDKDKITYNIEVPGSGHYDFNFISASFDGYKENNVLVDNEHVGVISVEGQDFQDSKLERIYLSTGQHSIRVEKSWGWIYLDKLIITASKEVDVGFYNINTKLVDKKANDTTKRLMKFIDDSYGKYIISGQYCDKGVRGPEFKAIESVSGKTPAMLGLDFIEYTPSRVSHGSTSKAVEHAIEFDELGGIVTFCWHWNAPEKYLVKSANQPWWKGFYKDATTIDLAAIMNGEDQEGYELLIRDIDAIALQLKRLEEADVAILWRPLHEAAGGWFWWGNAGHEAYIKLYQLLFDRLTNHHEIHNLIWVWNGQGKDWYPGDDYVDIVGTDIYPGERVYTPQVGKFDELKEWTDGKYVIALTENGCLFDPDLAFRDMSIWSFFTTWQGEFVTIANGQKLSEKYTEEYMVNKVYNHDKVLTLDELPNLKTYE